MGFLDDIKKEVIIADGAMGTLLYSYGIGNCFEELNLSHAEQIKGIHQAYLHAGSQMIQTNTYGANYEKLARYGLEDEVKRINAAAVKIAKEAVKEFKDEELRLLKGNEASLENKYIFGTIGGIRALPTKPVPLTEIKRNFREQLYCLLMEGVDGILLETFYDLEELSTVLEIARRETELPIVAQVSLHDKGFVQGGIALQDALSRLEDFGADVVGLNCRMGPLHMISSLEQVPIPPKAYLSAYPNASLPSYSEGRYHYSSNFDYFKESAVSLRNQGVRLIGGCCGTTPEHIKAIASAVKGAEPVLEKEVFAVKRESVSVQDVTSKTDSHLKTEAEVEASESSPPSTSLVDIAKERETVIVEFDTPKNLDTAKFLRGAQALKESGVDAITLADNSLATPRICNLSMAVQLKQEIEVPPLVHIACRDRNLIGMQSHLMGLSTLGINNVLAVTGDPAKVGDFPGATSVYDLSSIELIQLIKQCNKGLSFTGKPLGKGTNFTVAAAFNPNVRRLDQAVVRMQKKIDAGADYFMTQPVYSLEKIEELHQHTKGIDAPVYLGIMPLTSYRNAEFLHHEVPGIKLTDDVREAMAAHKGDKERSKQEGLAIAKHLIDGAMEYFNGIYLITPFLHYDITVELTKYIRQKAKERAGLKIAEPVGRKVFDGNII
ncbi:MULTISPECIES: bifunctional homocysteine S-methyltransferase/methylenetetrahydrofolate reductase [Bacillaceae]|uniref:Bifunctional homocysteine S-methyltransferase/methylenetetrahydrofolate reductase n=1 Tax=Evansella alkalicola TaxID=745819 RepID=A0ABS6JWK1_9BACI|nr:MULTISPECIES: bifunctional homocysteine S-methyltransferase/methylenetetrahydrofolate reductase [Bacillaceae]MBU9722946.1 bifunctional homocysteine S-methyltransferase/methylenetetrahydrofolate reductase [Bacillus alkalicola]